MQKLRVPINSFQFGEVSDSLLMRTDSPVYASSAQSLQNMIVMSEGSVKKRDGLKHIHSYSGITYSASEPDKSHLFRFKFSDDEQYIISVEHGKVNCFHLEITGDVTLVSTLTQDVSAATLPFDREYLIQYTVAQYGDVMFICHPLFMPRMLSRTSLTSFEVSVFSFDERLDGSVIFQPYTSFQSNGVTLDPDKTSGTGAVLTVSQAHWTAAHVGTTVRYQGSEIEITSVTSSTVAVGDIVSELKVRLSVLNPLRVKDGSSSVEVTQLDHGYAGGEAVVIEEASSLGGISVANVNGARTVSGIIDENTWTYAAGGAATSSEDGGGYVRVVTHSPTVEWSEQAFSGVRGYPAAVAFHENRLCLAGTINQPDAIWMSQIGSFFNFDVGDAADTDSISLVAATGTVNEIRYLTSNRDLQIFGASGELYVPTYLNQAITPTNAQIRLQTPYGCEFTKPASVDGATLFAQNGGKVVREYLYTDGEDAYTATAVSTIASHLISDPRYMTVAHGGFGTAESYAAITNGNGDIALFNSNRSERRASWTRLTTSGRFDSVCASHGRIFANIYDENGAMHFCEFTGNIGLDRYVTATATAAGEVTVSSAFADGETVAVVSSDGLSYHGAYTVASGKVTVTGGSAIEYHVGTAFTSEIITNPIDASTGSGPVTGGVRGVGSAILDLRNTSSVKVNGYSKSITGQISGKHEFRVLGYNRDPQITIQQGEPLPMQVNGLIAELII
jgi:hypothetical protein